MKLSLEKLDEMKERSERERGKREKEVLFTAFKSCRATRHEMAQLKEAVNQTRVADRLGSA